MLISLDPAEPGPLHHRIASSVRGAIADGRLGPHDRLPSARDLADAVDVNLNTVLRAYRDLRDEGLIELRRGRGATVTDLGADRSGLVVAADRLLTEARRLGLSTDEIVRLVEERA